MIITKERTRLIFTEYTVLEKKKIEDMVASMDNIFLYDDPDGKKLGLPTGMEATMKKVFPDAKFVDNSDQYWDYARIQPVEHNAQPRNQLQIDFINFVLENAKNKRKLAGILSPGTGKSLPLKMWLMTPNGPKRMGDIKLGDYVIGSDGNPTKVIGVYPQGVLPIYKITLVDGRTSECSLDHLWQVRCGYRIMVSTLEELIDMGYYRFEIPVLEDNEMKYIRIGNIEYSHDEEAQCISVDAEDKLYLIDQNILTHNTFMACYSAINVGLRTLIIVPTSGIKEQWGETLVKMFNVPAEKVLVVRSPKDFINVKADFVVVSQASLAVLNKSFDLEKIMKDNKFGIKVIDEVQMWFKNIVNVDANSNIANNWYLTGTFGRSGDTENKIYQEMFGDLAMFREKDKKPTIFNRRPGNIYGMKPHMNTKMIWTKSGLSDEEIKSVTSSMRYSEREGKWMRFGISIPAYTELIIPSDGRMTKFLSTILDVVKMAEKEVTYGKTLVLSPTIASCKVIAGYIQKIFPNKKVGLYNSFNHKRENDRVKAESDIIVSTVKSAGTGFDVKGLAKLIVAEAYKSWILSDQVSGRLRRRDDGKDTFMYDVVDSQIPQLRAWANNRASVLKKKSKSFKVIDM